MGLSDPEASLEISNYADTNLDALAMLLVGGWHSKYDLVSVFSAAMQVIEEKAQNGQAHARPD